MAPSLLTLGTAALACAGSAVATKWQLSETYDTSNFFDKFDFITGGSLNRGLAEYQTRTDAENKGLISCDNEACRLGVDHKTYLSSPGAHRDSVRIESKKQYKHGLFIARFTHLPENKCGLWPAFWTYNKNWPIDGEVDIYEQWNNAQWNQPALHMADAGSTGQCLMDGTGQSGNVLTNNCDNYYNNPPFQWKYQGCVAADHSGPWATRDGGVFAMEWTSEFIKLYSWRWANVPSNVGSDEPDSATWGTPVIYLKNKNCNIDNHFAEQRLVLNLDLCGNPAGNPDVWHSSCAAVTKQDTCDEYVANFPNDFSEAFFKVKDIRYFKVATQTTTTSATSSSTSSTKTSTSTTSSSATTTTSSATTSSTTTSSATSTQETTSTGFPTLTFSSQWSNSSFTRTTATSSSSTKLTTLTSSTDTTSTGSQTASTSSGKETTATSGQLTTTTSGSSMVTSTSSVEMTTSTVYTTSMHTVTKCPPWITDCPVGQVVTETIALYTTVCPVTATEKPVPTPTDIPSPGGNDKVTITTKVTKIYTITSCAPTVTNCPVGKVTTEVFTTTYCPGDKTVPYMTVSEQVPAATPQAPGKASTTSGFTAPSPFFPGHTTVVEKVQTVVPQATPNPNGKGSGNGNGNGNSGNNGNGNGNGNGVTTAIAQPAATTAACNGDNCPPKVVQSGAAKTSFSAFVVLCAVVALML